MIGTKIISKPKGTTVSGGARGGTTYAQAASTDEARHALEADHAKRADKAETADKAAYADKAVDASRAKYAETAKELDDESTAFDMFLRKDTDDTAKGNLTFEKNLDVEGTLTALSEVVASLLHSSSWSKEINGGSGFGIWMTDGNVSNAIFDNITVRGKWTAALLEIMKLSYSAGNITIDGAGATIYAVVPYNAGGQAAGETAADAVAFYRCYFKAADGERRITNEWHAGDYAKCQTFNLADGTYENEANRLYQRLVINAGTGAQYNGVECHYVDLANTATATINGKTISKAMLSGVTNDAPEAGDMIAHVGSATDTERQGAIQLVAIGADAPSVNVYGGINEPTQDMNKFLRIKLSPNQSYINTKFLTFTNGTRSSEAYIQCGEWPVGTTAYKNEVWQHGGSSWLCVVDSTTDEPSENSTSWRIFASQGKPGKDGLTVGRNLFCLKDAEEGVYVPGGQTPLTVDDGKADGKAAAAPTPFGYRAFKTSLGYSGPVWRHAYRVEVGKTYTVSLWIRGNTDYLLAYGICEKQQYNRNPENRYTGDEAKVWRRISQTFVAVKEYDNVVVFPSEPADVEICGIKIEEGDTPTAYMPNEKDLEGKDGINGKDGAAGRAAVASPSAVIITERATGLTADAGDEYTANEITYDLPKRFQVMLNGVGVGVDADTVTWVISNPFDASGNEIEVIKASPVVDRSDPEGETYLVVDDTVIDTAVLKAHPEVDGARLQGTLSSGGTFVVPIVFNRLGTQVTQAAGDITTTIRKRSESYIDDNAVKKTDFESRMKETASSSDLTILKDGLETAGVHVDGDKSEIRLRGDKVKIEDTAGNTAALFEDGKIKAQYIDAESLTAGNVSTKERGFGHIETVDGKMTVFNINGNRQIEFGMVDGYVVLRYYDLDGSTVLYDLGPDGLNTRSVKGVSVTPMKVRKVTTTKTEFKDTLLTETYSLYVIDTMGAETTIYYYQAAKVNGTAIADNAGGRSLTAAQAAAADGKYFDSTNRLKLGANDVVVPIAGGTQYVTGDKELSSIPTPSYSGEWPVYSYPMLITPLALQLANAAPAANAPRAQGDHTDYDTAYSKEKSTYFRGVRTTDGRPTLET